MIKTLTFPTRERQQLSSKLFYESHLAILANRLLGELKEDIDI